MAIKRHGGGRLPEVPSPRHHFVSPRTVADFSTLDDLINHAARDLGATHISGDGVSTRLYFPRGGQYPYEEATVWRKNSYWHAQGPGSRVGVTSLPRDARPIGGGHRRVAEAHGQFRHEAPDLDQAVLSWNSGDAYRDGSLRTLVDAGLVRYGRYGWVPTPAGSQEGLVDRRERLVDESRRRARVDDYIAVDRHDRPIAGPFKSYSDAKSAAGRAGVVKFVPSRAREVRVFRESSSDPFYIIQGLYSDGSLADSEFGFDDEDTAIFEAKKLARSSGFEGDFVRVITRDGEPVWDSRG